MILVVGQNSVWQKTYQFEQIVRGAVNRVSHHFESAAGKGSNVCRALAVYQVPSELHAYVGGANGTKFADSCHADGLATRFTTIAGETRNCVTLLEGDGTMTELVEAAPQISDDEREHAHRLVRERIRAASMLAIGGTAMTGESDDCYLQFVSWAGEQNVPVILDSYRSHGKRALDAHPQILKINRDELAELSGLSVETADDRIEAYRLLADRYRLRWIVITHGKAGAEGYNGHAVVAVAPPTVTAVNPIGSGDSVTAGVIAALIATGRPFDECWSDQDALRAAVLEGVACGTANCMNRKPGHIESADLEWVRTRCTVSHRTLS